MKKSKKIKRNLEVCVISGITRFARGLPRGLGFRVFSAMGTTASRLFKKDRDRAIRNLAMAFPEAPEPVTNALASAMFKSLGKNFFEFLNLEGSSKQRVTGLVEHVGGMENLDAALTKDAGLIVITGHIGCWELLAAYFSQQGYPLCVVGRELWEKRINERLIKIRESMGYRTIDRDSGGKEILRLLRDKKIIAVLIDQHTRVSGIYVPFFNRPAHTPTGVAKLAIKTGAPILPMAIYMRDNGRHEVRILPALEPPTPASAANEAQKQVENLTRECSHAIETLVRFDPKQWVWFHNRWRHSEERETGHALVS
ncbi:MAG: lysophospholipid acyltransferase family protein [Candidatus Latescibacterota bacterium]|nr:MAG: lysophospholipid acyltransferase family protein [Candidatus Latescibacterota bacterium]